MTTKEIAKKYIASGFSPIPIVDGEKRPTIKNWQQYAEEPMGLEEASRLFNNTKSIGLVMGFDGIQCLDIDAKHFTSDEYDRFCKQLDEEASDLRSKMIVQRTRSGGFHWIFKCDAIEGNQKLARNKKGEVTFETRGRGGQIVAFPSQGYKIEGKITNVTRITEQERDVLFRVARLMDEVTPIVVDEVKIQGDRQTDEHTPWGEFRESHTALDILLQNSWRVVGESTKYIYMLRPGDTDAKTSGVIFKDSGLFWPFTTSTEFIAEQPYDSFQCYAVLNHNSNFHDASVEIAKLGYGKKYEVHDDESFFDIEESTEEEIDEMHKRLFDMEVDSTIVVEQPEKCIDIVINQQSHIFGTLGNFSLIQGKAKSRKSYFISSLASAGLSKQDVASTLRGYIDDKCVVYVDTEQGDYHAQRVKKRILQMSGLPSNVNNDRLRYFKFRSLDSNKERLKFVEFVIQTIDNIGLLIIDGVADIASKGVNDEEEATLIASSLLKWSAQYNCHITIVLHENKNDRNAKGHLGAYLVQKAETTFSAKKSDRNKDITEITAEYTRNAEPPALEMTINALDEVEFAEIETDEFYNRTRVFTDEDKKRITAKIIGKSKGDALIFIRDTEDCKKKDSEKVLSQLEDERLIMYVGKRPKYIAYYDTNINTDIEL
jgi:hypothetical protein